MLTFNNHVHDLPNECIIFFSHHLTLSFMKQIKSFINSFLRNFWLKLERRSPFLV